MGTTGEPIQRQPADPHGEVDLYACFHEAAHVIVDRAFGFPVSAVWVRGEEGMVEAPPSPYPTDASELARHYWGRLCSVVAGDLGEFLYLEIVDAESGEWLTHEERVRQVEDHESFLRAFPRSRVPTLVRMTPRYPANELGLMFRYAGLLTGRVLPVTARLWWSIAGNGSADADCGSPVPTDASKALEYAGRVWSSGGSSRPFRQVWPDDRVDEDGLFPVFHIIRYAEVEAEQVLKREWDSVHAVATSLYRRKDHRMTGRQVDALLR